MTKKSKKNSRVKHENPGQTVVNIYNHGTVNIDARQNNSRVLKHENKGCTFNTADNASSECGHGELCMFTGNVLLAAFQVVEFMTNGINLKKNI